MTQEGPGAVPGVRIGAPIAGRAGCWEATAVTGGEPREVTIVRLSADPDVREAALASLAPVRQRGVGHRQEVVDITAAREGVAVIAAPAPGVAARQLGVLGPGELVTLGLPIARELAALHARGLTFGADTAALGEEIVVAPSGRPVLTVSGWVARRTAGGARPGSGVRAGVRGDQLALVGLLAAIAGPMPNRTGARWARVVNASDAQEMARALRRLARPRALPVPTASPVLAASPAARGETGEIDPPVGVGPPADVGPRVGGVAGSDSDPRVGGVAGSQAALAAGTSGPPPHGGPARSASPTAGTTGEKPEAVNVPRATITPAALRPGRQRGTGPSASAGASTKVRAAAAAGRSGTVRAGAGVNASGGAGARTGAGARAGAGASASRGPGRGAGRLPARPPVSARGGRRGVWASHVGTARFTAGIRRAALPTGLIVAVVVVATIGWSSARHTHSEASGRPVRPLPVAGAVAVSSPPVARTEGGATDSTTDPATGTGLSPATNTANNPANNTAKKTAEEKAGTTSGSAGANTASLSWPTSDAGWMSVVAALDQARGTMFASGRPVADVDVPGGSAYAADSTSVSELKARGLRAQGLLPVLASVAPAQAVTSTPATAAASGTDVVLAVSDTLPSYQLIDADGKVSSAVAGRGLRHWRVTVRATPGGWRIVEVATA